MPASAWRRLKRKTTVTMTTSNSDHKKLNRSVCLASSSVSSVPSSMLYLCSTSNALLILLLEALCQRTFADSEFSGTSLGFGCCVLFHSLYGCCYRVMCSDPKVRHGKLDAGHHR